MSILKCYCCGKSSRNAINLIVIGNKSYCSKCIKKMKVRKTGAKVNYYTNLGTRCFVEVRERGYVIREYHIKDLQIG
ncbi:hypothetical protein [Anaerovirgula multivorans]|uniref:hypothetical protein n=1 Tax=Anaerovirgula multivorans TaxID=312168 RepID=UPI0011307603|nr:hypothetical protein [Anaerovirgula multivorans]